MKYTHFLRSILTLLSVFVCSVAWADYKISFQSNSATTDGSTERSSISNIVSEGADYVKSISASKIYNGKTGYGIKLGTNSFTGTLTIELSAAGQVKPISVVVRACRYGSDTGNLNYKINGGALITQTLTSSFEDYEIAMDGHTTLNSLYFESSTKRIYIESVSVIEDSTPATAYTVSFDAGSNGSCSTSSLTEASAGAGVTLPSCTPNTGYVFKGWATTSGAATANAGNAAATYKPSADCTLYAVYASTHTATFMSNGSAYNTLPSVEEGASIVFPAVNPSVSGWAFMGWAESQIVGSQDNAPTMVSSATMGMVDKTFYAVFAKEEGGEVTETFGWEESTVPANWIVGSTITRTAADPSYYAASGSYYGLLNSNTSVQFKNKVKVKAFSYKCVRRTNNTNTSIIIQTSTNGNSWSDVISTPWNTFNSDGKTYTKIEKSWDEPVECYVRLNITTAANRQLDDISITYDGVTYSNYCTSLVLPVLQSIAVTTPPTKTNYFEGDDFDGTGMVVTATYNTGSRVVSGYTVSPSTSLAAGISSVTISYTDGEITKTATQTINVQTVTLTGISITTLPTKTANYEIGNQFDRTGMVVHATYNDSRLDKDVVDYDWSPKTFTSAGEQDVTISYGGQTATVRVDVVAELPKYTVTFSVNNTDNPVKESAFQAGVTPVAVSPIGDYTFAGWSETNVTEETTTRPTIISLTDGRYFPTADITLYAVFTKNKDVEKAGFTISAEYPEESPITYYAASPASNGSSVPASDVEGNAKTFFRDADDYIYFYLNGTKYYLQGVESDAKLNVKNRKSDANAFAFAENSITLGSRYIAYSGDNNWFRLYTTSTARTQRTIAFGEGSEVDLLSTPHYTCRPSNAVTPSASFVSPTTTVVVDQSVTNTVTTNSTGAVSYSSSDETIASVNATTGEVTGHKFGSVIITATIAEVPGVYYGKTANYTINVQRITPETAFKDAEDNTITEVSVYADNVYTFTAQTTSDAPIVYSLSAETYATVNSETGEVTFEPATGTLWTGDKQVTMYARTANTDRYAATTSSTQGKITITIKENRKTQTIKFPDASTVQLVRNATEGTHFIRTVTGNSSTVTYTSSNPTVATVNSETGEVNVNTSAGGVATITATAAEARLWDEEKQVYLTYQQAIAQYAINVDNMALPVISVPSGNYDAVQSVEITADDAALIVYTLDGTTPSFAGDNGEVYSTPIIIDQNCTLKAVAVDDDENESVVVSATYTFTFPGDAAFAWQNGASNHYVGDALIITAPDGCTVTYSIDGGEELGGSDEEWLSFAENGEHTVTAHTHKNGLTTTVQQTFRIFGPTALPFSYDGDNNNMPHCFIPYSLGAYGSSPAIQFNGTGDDLILLIEGTQDEFSDKMIELSYDYKFNGSWNSSNKFAMFTSEDGENYTERKAYTTQLTSGHTYSETILIPETTKFIRWTYSNKGEGNFGLGNIKVLPAGPELTIDDAPISGSYLGTQVVKAVGKNASLFAYTLDGTIPTYENAYALVDAVDGVGYINVTGSCTLKVATLYVDASNSAATTAEIVINAPTSPTDQHLSFERDAVHFFIDETLYISNYHGQTVMGANTPVTYTVSYTGDLETLVDEHSGYVVLSEGVAGTATITATAAAQGNWREASASYTITVGKLPAPTLTIDGSAFDPAEVYDSEQFAQLTAPEGYQVAYIIGEDLDGLSPLDGDISESNVGDIYLWKTYPDVLKVSAVVVVPCVRKDAQGVSHEEIRAVSDEVLYSIKHSPVYARHEVTFVATENDLYYATFSSPYDVFMTTEAEAYTVDVNGTYIARKQMAVQNISMYKEDTPGYLIPANTGVLLISENTTATYYEIRGEEPLAALQDNLLKPCPSFEAQIKFDVEPNILYYKLAYGNNTNKTDLGFWWGEASGGAFKVKPGTAYLAVPQEVVNNVRGFAFWEMPVDDQPTNIGTTDCRPQTTDCYNLLGQPVDKRYRGVVIRNGRLFINK